MPFADNMRNQNSIFRHLTDEQSGFVGVWVIKLTCDPALMLQEMPSKSILSYSRNKKCGFQGTPFGPVVYFHVSSIKIFWL